MLAFSVIPTLVVLVVIGAVVYKTWKTSIRNNVNKRTGREQLDKDVEAMFGEEFFKSDEIVLKKPVKRKTRRYKNSSKRFK